jgi:hypothetical protein
MLHGYWLWFVWALIALVVVVGGIRVRRHLNRVERAADAPAEHHRHEHEKKRHGGVE